MENCCSGVEKRGMIPSVDKLTKGNSVYRERMGSGKRRAARPQSAGTNTLSGAVIHPIRPVAFCQSMAASVMQILTKGEAAIE